ncbi:hypothetical protein Ddc_23940 [Ditylenchus destructor]|nr:hypothetical protein Ddc_23940 [Ditylenchus destructor]
MLTGGRDWLLGHAPSIADLSVYHPLWFVAKAGSAGADPAGRQAGRRGRDRAGPGLDAQAGAGRGGPGLRAGRPGHRRAQRLRPRRGRRELVGLSNDTVTLARDDERAGRVHVHFPRIRYVLRKAA